MSNVKLYDVPPFKCRTSKQFDVQHSNIKSQNSLTKVKTDDVVDSQYDTNVECQTVFTFDIRMSKVKMIEC